MKTYHSAAYPIAKARGLRSEFSVILCNPFSFLLSIVYAISF